MNTFCTVKLQIAHYISYSLFDDCPVTRITVVILELIRAQNLDSREKRCTYEIQKPTAFWLVIHNNCSEHMVLYRC